MGSSAIRSQVSEESRAQTSVADALFSGTRQTLLRLFFGAPDRGYTLTELFELAKAGRGAVQRETARLVAAGLVAQEGKSRGCRYRANPDAPIFIELCGIARKILGPAESLRAALFPLSDRIRLALLYGSVARGSDRADSDIDVLVVSDELLLEDVFEALAGVEDDLARTINPTLYTVDEFERRRAEKSPFLSDVLEGEHEVLLGALE
ncbi:MAG: nucleotidyltransferase domain-containing protein [Gammaproteobacteria bacterium]|nr:nucleotidyltransferase domain-containing protein [Gammaproteobacteria bacterium]